MPWMTVDVELQDDETWWWWCGIGELQSALILPDQAQLRTLPAHGQEVLLGEQLATLLATS